MLPFDAIADEVEETVAAGRIGILLQGGVHPDLRLEFYEGLLLQFKATLPAIRLHAFSAPGVWYIAEVYRMPLSDVKIPARCGAGIDPSGGAEILKDDTQERLWSRAKASTTCRATRWSA